MPQNPDTVALLEQLKAKLGCKTDKALADLCGMLPQEIGNLKLYKLSKFTRAMVRLILENK